MIKTRLTKQKKAILGYLKRVYTHPTAEVVYEALKEEMPKLSLATVYRNLHQLAQQGHVLELEINGEYHFDGHTTAHQHAICSNCGKIIDIHNKQLDSYALKKVKETSGFVPRRANIFFEGLCSECANKIQSND